jgi:hypothetical protein
MLENEDSNGPCAGSAKLRTDTCSLLLPFTGWRVSLVENIEDIPQVLPDPELPAYTRGSLLEYYSLNINIHISTADSSISLKIHNLQNLNRRSIHVFTWLIGSCFKQTVHGSRTFCN